MIKKIISVAVFVSALAFLVPVFAAQTTSGDFASNLPEKNGVYDVPGHPHLKLRVFVHGGRVEDFAKPSNSGRPLPPPPTETCRSASSSDPDSGAVVSGAGWKLPSSWSYNLNPTSVPSSVGSANLSAIASNAYDAWLAVVGSQVSIARGSDTTETSARLDSKNIIAWGRTSGSALAVSYIWYDTTTGVATEVDTIMNKKFNWYWSDPSGWPSGQICSFGGVYDAQDILTHELGHTFGLDDMYTSEYQNNTMFGSGATGETKKDTLTTGDKTGVGLLY